MLFWREIQNESVPLVDVFNACTISRPSGERRPTLRRGARGLAEVLQKLAEKRAKRLENRRKKAEEKAAVAEQKASP